ncbi:hypothetical protein ONA91_07995 [Micromonospora sp. DR5-3]|uniref:hypothetical protein n=1 Tax=unclassified Micromonospora TaxID=2617518 RepID=UPI0011D73915|nr:MULTISPECIES: hypothetical protein [unclassified Micromonospora]MCW3814398.1 hypothetical protein [Micromonospora sp. DR5-3]TYC22415.1 hypothetical protein FXF52_20640 [Micromonospora sp. MP36]
MTKASAMSMFAALLDRSVARIGELAADGRCFDRQAVVEIADVWDNHTFPLVGAAVSRPAWLRERRARAALGWMAEPGPARRAWMVEQAAVAGHRLEPLLPPPAQRVVHYRDYQGVVRPGIVPLTATAVASVGEDYDLARAQVRGVRVERAGPELCGYVALAAPRGYHAPGDHEAVVELFLSDVQAVEFDSGDRAGATLAADAAGVEVRVGAQGHLRAASATVWFDDRSWHLSHAGRAADPYTPRRPAAPRKPPRTQLRPACDGALDAAMVLHQAMLEIRSVRYAKLVGRVPLRELCEALAGAGDGVLTAAGQPPAARNNAFRRLAEKWITGSPSLAHRIADRFADVHWARALVPTSSPRPTVTDLPAQAQLTLAAYTAAHTEFGAARDASAVVNLAVSQDDGTWGLRAIEFPRPAHLSLGTAALTAPNAASYTAGVSLSLGGDFTVTCRERDPGC